MSEIIEQATQRYNTAKEFADSYIEGNEFTEGDPFPEWGALLNAVITVMTSQGLDKKDVLSSLEDDLDIIDTLLETEYMDRPEA